MRSDFEYVPGAEIPEGRSLRIGFGRVLCKTFFG